LARVLNSTLTTLHNGFLAWVLVVKLMVPALILTRLLLYFELIEPLSSLFKPIMGLMGLPSEMALVWVAGMVANIYVSIGIYLALLPALDPGLNLAQITTLAGLCLVAHSLLVEGQICRGTGMSFWRVSLFRILAGIFWGVLVHQAARLTGWGAEPAQIQEFLNLAGEPVPPWSVWLWLNLKQLFYILILIEALMLMMDLIKYFNLTRIMTKILGPPLRLAGVGESAVMVTVIGCVVGLAYGGGLIIAESRSGRLDPRDIFGAMMLMNIFHSALEDTMLWWILGASLSWMLAGRLILALGLTAGLTRLARRPFWRPILAGPAQIPEP
jgi:hypothetical protein